MRGIIFIFALCLSSLVGIPSSVLGQDCPEVRKLKERIERLEAETKVLKEQLVKLKQELAEYKSAAAVPSPAQQDPVRSLGQILKRIDGEGPNPRISVELATKQWFKHRTVARSPRIIDVKKTESLINSLVGEVSWEAEYLASGPFASEQEARQASLPKEGRKQGRTLSAKFALREGQWVILEIGEFGPNGQYRRYTITDGNSEEGYWWHALGGK